MSSLISRAIVCIFFFGFSLYSYVDKQNELTGLKLQIPKIAKEVKAVQETNARLLYEIDQFENPEHLMELARQKAFSHLKHPCLQEVLTVKEGLALHSDPAGSAYEDQTVESKSKVSLAAYAK